MSSFLPSSCVPFNDPITDKDDENKLLDFFVERVKARSDLEPNYYETSRTILLRFLIDAQYNLEVAYDNWVKFVVWRKKIGADSILDEHIKAETEARLGFWKGADKKGSKCCITVSSRMKMTG